jgi:serine/threonine protein phosphatase PrpC
MKRVEQQIWFQREQQGIDVLTYPCGTAVVFSQKNPRGSALNEDAAGLFYCCEDSLVMVVADGMGGANCGDQAAQAVVQGVGRHVEQVDNPANLRAAIIDAIEQTNDQILSWGVGAGATVVVAFYRAGVVRLLHVGDAEGLVCSNRGKIKLSTVSHAPVAMAVEIGVIDELTALNHDDRNIINNFVGSRQMRIEIGPSVRMSANDTLLLASDGLFDNLMSQEIVQLIRRYSLPIRGEQLLQAARERMYSQHPDHPAKADDLTAILFRQKPGPQVD